MVGLRAVSDIHDYNFSQNTRDWTLSPGWCRRAASSVRRSRKRTRVSKSHPLSVAVAGRVGAGQVPRLRHPVEGGFSKIGEASSRSSLHARALPGISDTPATATRYRHSMVNIGTDVLKIGGYRSIPMATAEGWISDYTDTATNVAAKRPFAFPAYDQYRADDDNPHVLDDADFLAPALLNAPISIRSYYALQDQRNRLQQALNAEELGLPLASLSDEQIYSHIGGLFAILDDVEPAAYKDEKSTMASSVLPGIGGTKLSKVLHRKRPQSVPLHDRWVRSCYVGTTGDPI
jgi:hypothetical protein